MQQIGHRSPDGSLLVGNHYPVNASEGAIQTLLPEQSGSIMLLDRATLQYKLPAVPIPGMNYTFISTIAATSHVVTASVTSSGTIFLLGSIQHTVDASATGEAHFADGTNDVGIALVSAETGGLIGATFKLTALSATIWNIQGLLNSSGTMTTPFTT